MVSHRIRRLISNPSVRKWLPLIAVLLFGAACAFILLVVYDPTSGVRPLPPQASNYWPEPVAGPNHLFLFRPNSGKVVLGTKYAITMATLCGLQDPTGPDFDGSFWDVADQTYRQYASGGPPPSFGAPHDRGYMVLVTADSATYYSSTRAAVHFSRHYGARVSSKCS
jgi:hypothetical protein